MKEHYWRFTNLKIRFEKLSYLTARKYCFIVACLDPACRRQINVLKQTLEKSFSDLGTSLLARDTCQLHCSIITCTNINLQSSQLINILGGFRGSVAAVSEVRPTQLIVTSKWSVFARATFITGIDHHPRRSRILQPLNSPRGRLNSATDDELLPSRENCSKVGN